MRGGLVKLLSNALFHDKVQVTRALNQRKIALLNGSYFMKFLKKMFHFNSAFSWKIRFDNFELVKIFL